MPEAVRRRGRAVPPGRGGSPAPTTSSTRSRGCGPQRPHDALRDRQAQRGRLGRGQRGREPLGLPAPGDKAERGRARAARGHAVRGARHALRHRTWPSSPSAAGSSRSAIIGEEIRSPSVQLRVTPLGELEVLSTHDQLLGGASGQSYLGCRFPADPAYAAVITSEAVKVGQRLAGEGVLGRFAFDFVVVRDGGRLDALRHRAQPAQGRHDAPVPDAAVPDRRPVRPGVRDVHAAAAERSASSRPTTSRRRTCGRWDAAARCSRSPARACTSTTSADRRRVAHAERSRRARAGRSDRRRRGAPQAQALYDRAHEVLFEAAETAARGTLPRRLRPVAPAAELALAAYQSPGLCPGQLDQQPHAPARAALGRVGPAGVLAGAGDVEVRPRHVADEALQELARR